MILTDRELVTVFWATCGAVVAIVLIVQARRLFASDQTSLTAAPRAADSPSAADSSRGQR